MNRGFYAFKLLTSGDLRFRGRDRFQNQLQMDGALFAKIAIFAALVAVNWITPAVEWLSRKVGKTFEQGKRRSTNWSRSSTDRIEVS